MKGHVYQTLGSGIIGQLLYLLLVGDIKVIDEGFASASEATHEVSPTIKAIVQSTNLGIFPMWKDVYMG